MKKKIPIVDNSFSYKRIKEFSNNPLSVISKLTNKYGQVFKLNLGIIRPIIITEPNVALKIITDHQNFIKSVLYRDLRAAIGKGLITSEGNLWRKQRKFIQPLFHKDIIKGYEQIIFENIKK